MKNSRYFYRVLLVIVTFIVFCQVIGHEFLLYDDDLLVYNNPHMRSFSVPDLLHFWKNPDYGNLYIPVTQTAWAILAVFAKTSPPGSNQIIFNPAVFHASNLIFHILNALLVFLILRILVKNESACFFGALLFAIHPVQVEPVAWVTGLKDVLSGFFSLVAIWQYLLYAKLSMTPPDGDYTGQDYVKWKTLHYLMALFSFLLAMLSKPASVIVPVAAFTLDYLILKRRFAAVAVSLIGWIIIALPVTGLTIYWANPADKATSGLSFFERLLVASDALAFYFYKLVVPVSLGPDYGRTPGFVLSRNFIYVAWLIPAALFAVIYLVKKHRSWLLASAGVFLTGILPVLGLMQFQFQRISTVADRYLYMSMLGPGMALAFFLSRDILPLNRKRLITGMCGAILCVLGILSMIQTQHWRNSIVFCEHAIRVNPDSAGFHNNLGNALAEQKKFDEAVFHYSEVLRLSPDDAVAHVNLGNVLSKLGRLDEADFHYSEASRLSRNDVEVHVGLGNILAQKRKFDEAMFHYSEALRLAPDNAQAHTSVGMILAQQEKFEEAAFHFHEALKSNPDNVPALSNLGYALARLGKFDEAVVNFQETLRLSPHDAGAHTNLGIVLAQQGKIDEAIAHFSEALKINPDDQDAYMNLIKAKSLKK